MPMQRILIIAVALVAAIGALFMVRNASGARAMTAPTAAASTPVGPKVLVAAKDIPAGSPASADMLTWTAWPSAAANPAFITEDLAPKAAEEFLGAVARVDIQSGEPITAKRLIKRGDKGAFAALIRPGYRATAIAITKETAAANFITPGDHVDVVLARKIEATGRTADGEVRSDVILENVRVLSIGDEIRAKDGELKPIDGAVATLELSPRDVETLALARKLGDLSLALRAVEPDTARLDSARRPGVRVFEQGGPPPAADGIKIHAFGRVSTQENAPK